MNKEKVLGVKTTSLCMKVGSPFFLLKGERRAYFGEGKDAYGAPVVKGEKVYVCANALREYLGVDPGFNTVTLGNDDKAFSAVELYEAKKLCGFGVTYNMMGLIIVSKEDDLFDIKEEIPEMIELMCEFVFDYPSESTVLKLAMEHTNGFKHPYILVDNDTFPKARARYDSILQGKTVDGVYKNAVELQLNKGSKCFEELALLGEDGKYLGIKPEKIPYQGYEESGGYDPDGGRHPASLGPLSKLIPLAFYCQFVDDDRAVRLSYDYLIALGSWEHWAPGHFLNCATFSYNTAVAYDWLFIHFERLGLDTCRLRNMIFENGVHEAYIASMDLPCEHYRKQGDASHYHMRSNNWNTISAGCMAPACAAVLDDPKARAEALYVLVNNLKTLTKYGMAQYAPDGSYIEAAHYWESSTDSYMSHISTFLHLCGYDFGMSKIWGLDKTFYFGCHVESSDYRTWNYHDGWVKEQDTSWYPFASRLLDDPELAALRYIHLKNGKTPRCTDIIYYDEASNAEPKLPLEYYMESMEAMTMRSSWNKGASYAGLMGESNHCPHGQIDSGSFIYHDGGRVIICDNGPDNYNVYGWWGYYNYYRKSAEGNNTLFLRNRKDLPFGQDYHDRASGVCERQERSELGGAIFILDNKEVYHTDEYDHARSARRGMYMTNGRRTLVIQDECEFNEEEDISTVWHYDTREIEELTLSEDKKSALVRATEHDSGKPFTVRITLLNDDPEAHFEVMDAYTFLLDETIRPGWSEANGGVSEYVRDYLFRLVTKQRSKKIRQALVFERTDVEAVGYELTDMANWKI